jgi:hypothetical protein
MVRELSATVGSEFRRTTVISNAMSVVGLAIIALLMPPLGRLPNPQVPYVSMVLLSLLLQRMVLMAWDGDHKRGGGLPSARMAAAFALPLVAAIAFQSNPFQSVLMLGTWVVIGMLIAEARLVGEQRAQAPDAPEPARSPLGLTVA